MKCKACGAPLEKFNNKAPSNYVHSFGNCVVYLFHQIKKISELDKGYQTLERLNLAREILKNAERS